MPDRHQSRAAGQYVQAEGHNREDYGQIGYMQKVIICHDKGVRQPE
jgi:hypothetical protein